jgi:hypothetical protein
VHVSLASGFAPEYDNLVAMAAAQVGWHPQVPANLAGEISEQLVAYDYDWDITRPVVSGNSLSMVGGRFSEYSGPETDSGRVIRYLRGYLVFSGFARLLGADHLIPPGWSRLYAAANLPVEPDDEMLHAEEKLFAILAEAGNADPAGLGRTVEFSQPTFLPYLLDDPQCRTPLDIFRNAIALRDDPDVGAYIDFRSRVRQDLKDGKPEAHLREINELAALVGRKISKSPRSWKVRLSASLSVLGVPNIGVGPADPVDVWRPIGWSLRQLPGKAHAKLLLRLLVAQHEKALLLESVRERWEAA